MKAKLIKHDFGYNLVDENNKWIATSKDDYSHSMNLDYWLSLKNCQAIERGYDLDELIEEVYPTPIFGLSIERKRERASFKSGFQKALEILGDKKFTEEDMAREIHLWDCHINVHEEDKGCLREIYKRVKSLQQNEWEVEVEMDFIEEEQTGTDLVWGRFTPKLDADGCLILKRV